MAGTVEKPSELMFVTVPTGTTHFQSLNHQVAPMFYRQASRRWDTWDVRRQAWQDFDASAEVIALLRPLSELRAALSLALRAVSGSETLSWAADSLPPIGMMCEVENPHEDGQWCQCTIIAWEAECAVFRAASDYPYVYDGRGVGCFRPLGYGDERAQMVESMYVIALKANDRTSNTASAHDMAICEALYDAGCRLPEAKS